MADIVICATDPERLDALREGGVDQLLRPYDRDQRILYDRIAVVRGIGIERGLAALLADDEVDFVLVRNVLSGCWSFTARRA